MIQGGKEGWKENVKNRSQEQGKQVRREKRRRNGMIRVNDKGEDWNESDNKKWLRRKKWAVMKSQRFLPDAFDLKELI